MGVFCQYEYNFVVGVSRSSFAKIKLRIAFQLKLSSVPMTDSNTAKQMRIRLRSMMCLMVVFQSFRTASLAMQHTSCHSGSDVLIGLWE